MRESNVSDRTLTKVCPNCGTEFTVQRGRGTSRQMYCGKPCRRAATVNNPNNPPCQMKDGDQVCGRPVRTPGVHLCQAHYQRQLKYGDTTLRRRVPNGSCLQCDGPLPSVKHRFYCSEECGYLNRTGYDPKVDRECAGCGAPIDRMANRKRRFCTTECAAVTARYQRYGATLDEARQMRRRDRCEICGAAGVLAVDHCHDTGEIRGMLCSQCNVGIGMFRDDADLLMRAIRYLKR